MSNWQKHILGFSVLGASLFSAPIMANEYLPPPTGPYQSSVIINTVESDSDVKPQVYRFPPSDLIQPRTEDLPPLPPRPVPETMTDTRYPNHRPGAVDAVDPSTRGAGPPLGSAERRQPYRQDASAYANPWAVNPYAGQQAQGGWSYPYSGYAYPYDYSSQYQYNNQYNNNAGKSPFSFMPSPWSVMPMQPDSGQ